MPNDAVLIDAIVALNPGVACEVAEGDRCVTWSMWTAHDPDVFLESISGHRLNAFKDEKPEGHGSDLRVCGGQGWGRTADLPIFRPKEPVRERRSEPNSCSGERSSVPIRSAVQERALANPLANWGDRVCRSAHA